MVKLIDFHAGWCNPCKKQELILEEVEDYFEDKEYIDFDLVKVDVDDEVEKAQEYKVRSVPTLIIEEEDVEEDEDKIVERFVGITSKEELIKHIEP